MSIIWFCCPAFSTRERLPKNARGDLMQATYAAFCCSTYRRRTVQCGAWPEPVAILKRQFEQRGIPEAAIVMPPQICRTTDNVGVALRDWLKGRESTSLIVLGREFHGRYDRRVLNAELPSVEASKIKFAVLRTGVDENNWWQSREGIQLVFQNYAALAFEWWNGPAPACKPAWTLKEYESNLPALTDN